MARLGRKIFTLVTSFLLAGSAVGIGGIALCCHLNIISDDLLDSSIRKYNVNFYDDFGEEGVIIYSTPKVKRGDEVDYSNVPTPEKRGQVAGKTYTFLGWDITYDNIPDTLPSRLYLTLRASAVWRSSDSQSNNKYSNEELRDSPKIYNVDFCMTSETFYV